MLGIGVETTYVAEEALERGRSVEFYVLDEEKRGMLGTRILDSFRTAFSRGLFKVLAVVLKDMPRPRAHVSDLFQALAVFFAGMPRPRSHVSYPTSQVVAIGVLLTSPHVEVTFGVFVEFSYACLVLRL